MSSSLQTSPVERTIANTSRGYNSEQKKRCLDHISNSVREKYPRHDIELKELKQQLVREQMRNADKCLEIAELHQANTRLRAELSMDMQLVEEVQLHMMAMIMESSQLYSDMSSFSEEEKDNADQEVGEIMGGSVVSKMEVNHRPVEIGGEVVSYSSQQKLSHHDDKMGVNPFLKALSPNPEDRFAQKAQHENPNDQPAPSIQQKESS